MTTVGNENMSDEIFDFVCSNCVKVKKHREAVKCCLECQGYCCQSCVDSHQTIPALVGHNLMDKASFKSLVLTTNLPTVPTERCQLHRTKIVDFYCRNHDIVGCSSCIVLDHRSCSDVQAIPEAIDDLFKRSDVEETYQNVQEINVTLEKIKNSRKTLLQQLRKSKADALNVIKEFRKDMESLLDELETASVKEVEDTFRKLESDLTEQEKRIEEELGKMKLTEEEFRKAEGNNAQRFVCMKRAQEKIQQAREISSSVDSEPKANILFLPNATIRDSLKDIKSFGLVEIRQCSLQASLYSIKATKEINVHLQSDPADSYVEGSCTTEDGILLLADYNNQRLKRADPSTLAVLDYCDFPARPCSVCCISKQEAVVTMNNKTVLFVALGNQMTPTRQLKFNHYCCGILHKDDMLIISDNTRSVYIYDMTGKLVQTVSQDGSGKALFTSSRHVAAADCGDTIFVGDDIRGLVYFDEQGRHAHTFRDPGLSGARGVCTDRRGNVFVCGRASHNVLQVAQGGRKKVQVIATPSEGIRYPLSLCFDTQNLTLFVTQNSSNIVKVFQLQ